MNVTVARQPKSQVKLTIELSMEDMQPHLDKAAETLSAQHKIEGFRPGKASLGIVIQKLGAQAVWQEAAEFAVRKSFTKAVMDEKLMAIGQPNVTVVKLAPENPFIYTAEIAILPEVRLGSVKDLKAKKEEIKVTVEEIDKAVEDLRSMFASEAQVDRPAQKDDKIEVDFDLFVDNVAVENGSSKQHPVIIGSGNFIPGFEDNIIGMKKDDTKEFVIPFPKDYRDKNVAGKNGTFKVKALTIFEIKKPDINDEFAARAGKFKTVAELREKIEENLKAEKDSEVDRTWENALIDEVIERSSFGELPEMLIESETKKMIEELQNELLQRGGLKFDDYLKGLKKTAEELAKDFRPQSERRVKASLAIRQIAKDENVTVDDEKIEEEVKQTLKMYEHEPSLKERIDSPDYRDYVRTMLTNRRVIELLKEWALGPSVAPGELQKE